MSIWNDVDRIKQLCAESLTYSDVCRALQLTPSNHIRSLKAFIKNHRVDVSHFDPNANRKATGKDAQPIAEILTVDSTYHRWHLKKRLVREGILVNVCSECSCPPVWNGKELNLQLDHINGINTDNRLENLRLLCPNCHSQTSTFAGRNKR